MKGISTIIAAIILVVITIGLIATAYLYFAGIVSVGPVVAVSAGYCNYDSDANSYNVTLTLKNDGTATWTDLTFMWDGQEVDSLIADCESIDPGGAKTCMFVNGTPAAGNAMPEDISGTHTLNAIGPRNQAGGPITCM